MVDEVSPHPDRPLAASLRLFADLDAPSQARSFVRDFCSASGFPAEFRDVAVLLVEELVSKAVDQHGAAPTVEIERADTGLRISVHDGSSIIPSQRLPNAYAESGLMLLDRLATAWGVTPRDSGKAVWFELCMRPRAS